MHIYTYTCIYAKCVRITRTKWRRNQNQAYTCLKLQEMHVPSPQFTKCRFYSQNHACTRVAETHRNVHVQVFVQHTNHMLTIRKQHIITQCLTEYLAHMHAYTFTVADSPHNKTLPCQIRRILLRGCTWLRALP